MNNESIRNFVVIAHIDHGKSTLADRFLELTHAVDARNMRPQMLDQMDLERERGITIKMQPVRMIWRPNHTETRNSKFEILNKSQTQNSKTPDSLDFRASDFEFADSEYILNLIDTPGHIDFSYEVSRALAAVEGAVLLVDATQGVQAQTLTNLHIAQKEGLAIIPAVNKIDAADARVPETVRELAKLLGCPEERISRISGRTGAGVQELLERVVREAPPPTIADTETSKLRALIFDSAFESHRGVIAYVRVFSGEIKKGSKAYLFAMSTPFEVKEVGIFAPALTPKNSLQAGEIGYVVTGIKNSAAVSIGDTIILASSVADDYLKPLPGYARPQPVVWANFYPEKEQDFDALRDALSRLQLNDAAFRFEPEFSTVLGRSFACGFLGMLHLEIVTERLRREFSLSVVVASPSIAYEVTRKNGIAETITSAAKFPPSADIQSIREPWITAEIITPGRYLGNILALVDTYEGKVISSEPLTSGGSVFLESADIRMKLFAELPLREIVSDFFDTLKSVTAGYASFTYELAGKRPAHVERIDILIAEEQMPALARIVSGAKALTIARSLVGKLKEVLPRQLFQVKIQAVINGRIAASETISALKKDVTGYLYGGDRTRKMKLWKKQKEGKKRMKSEGKAHIPPEAFLQIMKH